MHNHRRTVASMMIVLALSVACRGTGATTAPSSLALWPTETWPTSTPEEQGMDKDFHNVVLRDGSLPLPSLERIVQAYNCLFGKW